MLRRLRGFHPWSRSNLYFVCGAALVGRLFFLGEFHLRGQITFFDFKKYFGIIVAETGERHFLSGHDLANPVDRNDWVAFDSKLSLVSGAECNLVAKNVCRIECPEEYLLRGTITKFFRDSGYVHQVRVRRPQSIDFLPLPGPHANRRHCTYSVCGS